MAITAIRLLQRRNESLLVGHLAQLLQDDLPEPAWEVTLYALGQLAQKPALPPSCWNAGLPVAERRKLWNCSTNWKPSSVTSTCCASGWRLLQEGKITAEEEAPLLAWLGDGSEIIFVESDT